jgi:hypothetical protein
MRQEARRQVPIVSHQSSMSSSRRSSSTWPSTGKLTQLDFASQVEPERR